MELDQRKCLQKPWMNGIREPKKLSQLTGTPLRTCYDFRKRMLSGQGVERKQGSARPRKLKEDDMRRITQIAHHHPKCSSAKVAFIAHERGSPRVHKTTISRNLKRRGYLKWTPTKFRCSLTNSDKKGWIGAYKM